MQNIRGDIENNAKHWGRVINGQQVLCCQRKGWTLEATPQQKVERIKFRNAQIFWSMWWAWYEAHLRGYEWELTFGAGLARYDGFPDGYPDEMVANYYYGNFFIQFQYWARNFKNEFGAQAIDPATGYPTPHPTFKDYCRANIWRRAAEGDHQYNPPIIVRQMIEAVREKWFFPDPDEYVGMINWINSDKKFKFVKQ